MRWSQRNALVERLGKIWANRTFAFYSWLELGSPCGLNKFEPRPGMYRSGASVSSAACHLVGEAMAFDGTGSALRGPASTGQQQLMQQLAETEEAFYQHGHDWTLPKTGAGPIQVLRVALPEVARARRRSLAAL